MKIHRPSVATFGGIGSVVVASRNCSSMLPGSMSERFTGSPSARRAAHSPRRVTGPDSPSTGISGKPYGVSNSLSFACWSATARNVSAATTAALRSRRCSPVMSSRPLSMHTSRSWSGTTRSSASAFSAWMAAIVTISSARSMAMPPSESPGCTCTTHAGSYTASGGSVVVVVVVVLLAGGVVVGSGAGAIVVGAIVDGAMVDGIPDESVGATSSRASCGPVAITSVQAPANNDAPTNEAIRRTRTPQRYPPRPLPCCHELEVCGCPRCLRVPWGGTRRLNRCPKGPRSSPPTSSSPV